MNAFESDSLHKQSQSLEENNQFKTEYSFLGEGQKFSWETQKLTFVIPPPHPTRTTPPTNETGNLFEHL